MEFYEGLHGGGKRSIGAQISDRKSLGHSKENPDATGFLKIN